MARTRSYAEYRRDLQETDKEGWLGQLLWYGVPETTRVDHAALIDALQKCALEDWNPPRPADDDVFRRVCTKNQRKNVETDDPDVFENYLMRDVKRTGGTFVKQIVVEQVDSKHRRLDYKPAVQLEFDRTSGKIMVTPLVSDCEQAQNLADLIVKTFEAEKGKLSAPGIRELIRKVLMDSNATIVRPSGGIYFLGVIWNDRVASLEMLAGLIGITVHPCPLLDDKKQRAMLREAFKSETVDSIDKMLGDIDKMLAGEEISETRYNTMFEQMQGIKEKTTQYAELLEEEFGNAEFRLDIFQKKMRQLLNHVKVD